MRVYYDRDADVNLIKGKKVDSAGGKYATFGMSSIQLARRICRKTNTRAI